MKNEIQKQLKSVLREMGITDMDPVVEISGDSVHGEYTTNIAMRMAKILKKPPMEIGLEVVKGIKNYQLRITNEVPDQSTDRSDQKISVKDAGKDVLQVIESIDVVPPGFINIKISVAGLSTRIAQVLEDEEAYGKAHSEEPQGVMVEFGDPNTHKMFHVGHLRNISIGESVVRLLAAAGVQILRTSYQGDVGMHIGKCLYGLLHPPYAGKLSGIRNKNEHDKVEFLGKAYAAGAKAFEEDEKAKLEIALINKKIYAKDPEIMPLYKETRSWSLEYFETIYKRVGTHYDRNYFESEVFDSGKANVLTGLKKGIFMESKGAVIFPGSQYALHDRVFITSEGNPTYEGKDMGLGPLQYADLKQKTDHPTRVIRVVGPEQAGYFQVVFEAQSQLFPELRDKFYHLIAGWVKLKKGKMSSRLGNVVLGEWLLDEAKKRIYTILSTSTTKDKEIDQEEVAEKAALAAVKYAFLKVATNQEISFDFDESISFDGDSGPYLLYTYARCKSVLRKANELSLRSANGGEAIRSDLKGIAAPSERSRNDIIYNPEERAVARFMYLFPEIVAEAAGSYSPNVVCRYLFQLAQAFNVLYAKHKIADDPGRLALTAATAQVLQNGLYLLGIATVERM